MLGAVCGLAAAFAAKLHIQGKQRTMGFDSPAHRPLNAGRKVVGAVPPEEVGAVPAEEAGGRRLAPSSELHFSFC